MHGCFVAILCLDEHPTQADIIIIQTEPVINIFVKFFIILPPESFYPQIIDEPVD